MRKVLPLFMIATSAISFANELDASGYIWTNLWSDWKIDQNDEFKSPDNFNTTEINVNTTYRVDQGFSANIGLLANSSYDNGQTAVPFGRTKIDDTDNQISEIHIDTYGINWEMAENGVLSAGRFYYTFGTVDNFYPYSYDVSYSAISAGKYILGLALNAGGFEAYFGFPTTKMRSLSAHVNYPIELINTSKDKLVIHPMFEYTSNQGRNRNFILGTTYHYSSGNETFQYALDGVAGMLPYQGNTTYTLLTEPSFKIGSFTMGMGYYYASLADDTVEAALQTDLPDVQFAYVEPLFEINDMLGIGLPFSWHDHGDIITRDQSWLGGLNLYLYPTEGAEIKFFGNYLYHEVPFQNFNSSGDSFILGLEAKLEF